MAESRRLFFALTLPSEVQQQIIHWRAAEFPADAGRPVAAANLHLTLAFLGDVSEEKCRALSRLAGRIRQPGFNLKLDDAGQWLRSSVVWMGPRQAPRGLLQLANMLRSQAARSGCYQSPLPFHPHITLYRNAIRPVALPAPGFSWQFRVEEFSLYQSIFEQGRTRYQTLERWPLTNKEE
ncbi:MULTISPECIES: RNA 2',3'-cyclic phosphodiesterase [Cedecea]|uniref:RNA 2',3'-cyclic phosphodiesterase n=1 Tax=Cedecea davisae TaxID=158484 RepID=A0ABS6DF77_9ENTR|nr:MULTISPECIES: RNA 2',3'-cyclic phosphodiesterase [Cedecea]MBU4681842.1 RNA 2',3'-cyclic phosphodiesterase [Cedecea davisae]MBU4685610.1 RNA 2',3'-cyclic phosphodiesterase [Cedecea davisae]QIX95088.1 RNA 2',3'-cyclic phosphodiesterase [Cedecea sp. FDAARGOS_727]